MSTTSHENAEKQPTLLVVDDNEAVRSMLTHILDRAGYRIIVADSGASAVLMASTERIDGALIDVHMTGMNGFECLRLIQQNRDPTGEPLRVWFITGAPTSEIRQAVVRVGAIALLPKPFELTELLGMLKVGFESPLPQIGPSIG